MKSHEWDIRHLIRSTFLRFLIAGGVNTLFGFLVYTAFIFVGVRVWIALICSTVVGIAFNFLTTGGYAFRDLSPGRVPKFIICYVVIFGTNLELITVLMPVLHDKILVQMILAPPLAVLSYYLLARFVFFRKLSL